MERDAPGHLGAGFFKFDTGDEIEGAGPLVLDAIGRYPGQFGADRPAVPPRRTGEPDLGRHAMLDVVDMDLRQPPFDHQTIRLRRDFENGRAGLNHRARSVNGERQHAASDRRTDLCPREILLGDSDARNEARRLLLDFGDLPLEVENLRTGRKLTIGHIRHCQRFLTDQVQLPGRSLRLRLQRGDLLVERLRVERDEDLADRDVLALGDMDAADRSTLLMLDRLHFLLDDDIAAERDALVDRRNRCAADTPAEEDGDDQQAAVHWTANVQAGEVCLGGAIFCAHDQCTRAS